MRRLYMLLFLAVFSCHSKSVDNNKTQSRPADITITQSKPVDTIQSKPLDNAKTRCNISDEISYPNDITIEIDNKQRKYFEDKNARGYSSMDFKTIMEIDTSIFIFKNDDKIMTVVACCDSADIAIFRKDLVPDGILNISTRAMYPQLNMDNRQFVKEKINYATEIDSKYFVTKMGLKLGMTSAEVVKIYGLPDSNEVINKNPEIIRYKWELWEKSEAEDELKYMKRIVPKEKVCTNNNGGKDYYVDFLQEKGKDEAVMIYIYPHPL